VRRPTRAAAVAVLAAAGAAACANTANQPDPPPSSTASSAPSSTSSAPSGTAGAGADNGVRKLAVTEILSRTQAALLQASTVTIKASGGANGTGFSADVDVQAHKGGAGTLTVPGGAAGRTFDVQVITIGTTAYVKGDAAAWQTIIGSTPTVPDIDSKWVRASTDNAKLRTLVSLADVAPIATGVIALDADTAKGAESTIDGTPVIALTNVGPTQATVYVATQGQPYPVRISQSGAVGGQLDFTDFDQPVDIAAPAAADTIDASQLGL
jgi:hypothetical protein